jgi:hypothetical protein
LYQIFALRKLDTTKKRGVTRLYTMPGGGFFLARNTAGESLASLAIDCTVKSARRSGYRRKGSQVQCENQSNEITAQSHDVLRSHSMIP